MRDLVELTGEWPLLEDGEESPEVSFRQPGNWHRLAQEARRLGFESDEITRIAMTNPDEQVALKALHDARPASFYEYNTSELQDILNRIFHEFSKARGRTFEDLESTFTTIGAGEPINRRCGRQYSGSYIRDRWSFELSAFSQTIAESRDITSLFVRKSVFHAFWRLNEDPDGDEPMLRPGDLPMAFLETSPVDSPKAHAEPELNDEPMLETNNSRRQSREGRPSCQRSRGKSLTTKKRATNSAVSGSPATKSNSTITRGSRAVFGSAADSTGGTGHAAAIKRKRWSYFRFYVKPSSSIRPGRGNEDFTT
ncbi:intracellular protein transport protein uso1 [Fusarium langsethiae]|uniref:Intracellular protein transport protein uso1 n=1 Tax=Fusarium langsethiae TaxID=179993 RepID=A0A0N1J2G7_FUSLA|nr:intracellular protein transport protein uso1 [Fusarium langsethiae]GKU05936.1 unnamed protein product [Fusarium langsethiae]